MKSLRSDVMFVFPTLNGDTAYNTDFEPKINLMDTIPENYTPSEETIRNSKYQVDRPPTLPDIFGPWEEILEIMFNPFAMMQPLECFRLMNLLYA